MKIVFRSVGKPHEKYIKDGVEDFTSRISKYFRVEWEIIAPPRNAAALSPAELKKQESVQIISMLNDDDFLVLLDERGKNIASVELSELLQKKANDSLKRMIFLIGGAYGVDENIRARADFSWSLSRLVFPHMLVRLILAEQVYRACTILRNEKYHHS
ncbi:MAG TPA: 23S rRNA (pseudouridine(1915)-N(3))-methyltransferase RlmH [Chitinophagaceae bacterium]